MNPSRSNMELVGFALSLGFMIALPLVIFTLAGLWVDHRYGTRPWGLLIGVVVAIITTSITVGVRLKRLMDTGSDISSTTHAS